MSEAYIIDAVRTPRGIGKVGKGALAHMHPQHLAATVLKAIAEKHGKNAGQVGIQILLDCTHEDLVWTLSNQSRILMPRE